MLRKLPSHHLHRSFVAQQMALRAEQGKELRYVPDLEIFCPNNAKLRIIPSQEPFSLGVDRLYQEACHALPFGLTRFVHQHSTRIL